MPTHLMRWAWRISLVRKFPIAKLQIIHRYDINFTDLPGQQLP